MAVYTKVEFKNLCRLCISYSQNSEDIFGEKAPSDLNLKISRCLSLKIEENDPLPKKICKNCLERLDSFNEFRLSCCNSDSTLQCYYSLFKSTIDFDGTIFIKSDDVQEDGDTRGLVSTTTNIISTTDKQIYTDYSGTLMDQNLISADLSLASRTERSSFQNDEDGKQPSTSNLTRESTLGDINESFPLVSNNDGIVVVDINKCNIFDFIDPRAPIYVVNVDDECKENMGLEMDNQEAILNDKSELSTMLQNPCTNNDDIVYEPEIDQRGIENINEFLRNIYPNQKQINNENINHSKSDSSEKVLLKNISDKGENKDIVQYANASSSKRILDNVSDTGNETLRKVESAKASIDDGIIDFTSVLVNSSKTGFLDTNINSELDSSGNIPINSQASKQSNAVKKKSSNANLQGVQSATKSKPDSLEGSNKTKKTRKVNPTKDNKNTEESKTSSSNEQNECLLCHKTFSHPKALKAHMTTHQEHRIFKCQYCNKCFGRNWHRNRHIESAHNPQSPAKREFVCHICSKKYAREEHLTKHMLVHSRVYACEKCGTILDTEASFRRHKMSDCLVKHVCEKCGAQFDSKTCYLQHINSKCGQDTVCIPLVVNRPGFKCTMCNSTFTARWILKRHMEQHKRIESSIDRDISGEITIQHKDVAKLNNGSKESVVSLVEDIPEEEGNFAVVGSHIGSTSNTIDNKSHFPKESSIPADESTSDSSAQSANEKINQNILSKPDILKTSVFKNPDKKDKPTIEVNFGQFIKDLLKKPSYHQRSIHALLDSLVQRSKQSNTSSGSPLKHQTKDESLSICALNQASKKDLVSSISDLQHPQNGDNPKEGDTTVHENTLEKTNQEEAKLKACGLDKTNKFTSSFNEVQVDDFLRRIVQNILTDESSGNGVDCNAQTSKVNSSSIILDSNYEGICSDDKIAGVDLTGKFLSSLEESYRKYRESSKDDHTSVENVREDNADLVLKINDNLPDTLLTASSNFESYRENSSDKSVAPTVNEQRHFSEESENIFESDLDNLLDTGGTTFDNDLESLLDEAANKFEECAPEHFTEGNLTNNMLKQNCPSTNNEVESTKKHIISNGRNILISNQENCKVSSVTNEKSAPVVSSNIDFHGLTDASTKHLPEHLGNHKHELDLDNSISGGTKDLSKNLDLNSLSNTQFFLKEDIAKLKRSSLTILPEIRTPIILSGMIPDFNKDSNSDSSVNKILISKNISGDLPKLSHKIDEVVLNKNHSFSKLEPHTAELPLCGIKKFKSKEKNNQDVSSQMELKSNQTSYSSQIIKGSILDNAVAKINELSTSKKPILDVTGNEQELNSLLAGVNECNTSKLSKPNSIKINLGIKEKCSLNKMNLKSVNKTSSEDMTDNNPKTDLQLPFPTLKKDGDLCKDQIQILNNDPNSLLTQPCLINKTDQNTLVNSESEFKTSNSVDLSVGTGSQLKKSLIKVENYLLDKCRKKTIESGEYPSEILGQFNSQQDLREFVKYSQKILSPVVRISRTIVTADRVNRNDESNELYQLNEDGPSKRKLLKSGVKQSSKERLAERKYDEDSKINIPKTSVSRKITKQTKDLLTGNRILPNYLDKCVVFLPKVDTNKLYKIEKDDMKRQSNDNNRINLSIKRQKCSKEILESEIKDVKNTTSKLDQFNSSVSVDNTISEESSKQPIKTIRILLERFNPQKIAQFAEKSDSKPFLSSSFAQPYNLRKTKDVQTYICTMEDS